MHPRDPELPAKLENLRKFTTEIGRWIGQLGSKLMARGCPDVAPRPDPASLASRLEITEVPDTSATGGLWTPRLYEPERRKAACLKAKPRQQPGLADAGWHMSHSMYRTGEVHFCWECGGYSQHRKSELLATPCRGHAKSVALRDGIHPTTGVFLGAAEGLV